MSFAGLTSFPKQVDGHHVEHDMLNVVNLQFKGELGEQERERCSELEVLTATDWGPECPYPSEPKF
jgi:hypothetical protein